MLSKNASGVVGKVKNDRLLQCKKYICVHEGHDTNLSDRVMYKWLERQMRYICCVFVERIGLRQL